MFNKSGDSRQTVEARKDLFGRTKLIAKKTDLSTDNVAKILNDVIHTHKNNSEEIDYLHWYYRGKQPILYRTKKVKAGINNTVLENRAFEAVNFRVGYEYSTPVQYTNISENSDLAYYIDLINAYSRVDGKNAKDAILAEWIYKCGVAYRFCMATEERTIDDPPFYTAIMDPRSTFVVRTSGVDAKPLLACSYAINKIKKDNKELKLTTYVIYTPAYIYEWEFDESEELDFTIKAPISIEENGLKMIPIIEYSLNENLLGLIEVCMSLFNAINCVASNRVDGIEQFIQALLVFINCDLPIEDGETKLPENNDAVSVVGKLGMPASVKYLVAQLDQQHAQITKEDLVNAYYDVLAIPGRRLRMSGGDTGRAVDLGEGWAAAETSARLTEKYFERSEYEYLKIVLNICRRTVGVDIGELTLKDIGVKFQRNRSDNMLVKSQTYKMLLDAGCDPADAAVICELFADPIGAAKRALAWQGYLETKNNTEPQETTE